jgi:uncharacterized membrane protein
MEPKPAPMERRGCTERVNRGARWLARHWLALLNLFWCIYVGLPMLAPVLMDVGWTGSASVIYLLYRPACHQRPERSFFIDGPQAAYSKEELAAAGIDVDPLARATGNTTIGWKMAFCERDTAMYGAILATGLAYGLFRKRLRRIRMPFRIYLLFLIPIGVDGTLQLLGLYESTWLARTLTGALFGVGSVLFAYPYLDDSFGDLHRVGPEQR